MFEHLERLYKKYDRVIDHIKRNYKLMKVRSKNLLDFFQKEESAKASRRLSSMRKDITNSMGYLRKKGNELNKDRTLLSSMKLSKIELADCQENIRFYATVIGFALYSLLEILDQIKSMYKKPIKREDVEHLIYLTNTAYSTFYDSLGYTVEE